VALDLATDGISIIRGSVDPALCDAAVSDYEQWLADRKELRLNNLDTLGREKRLVNFHLASKAAEEIATNEGVMSILDQIFGISTHVYTSLTFRYGTQQPIHRDTPHFATWPARRFVGVWTALEDIHPDAGPLMYVKGGQNYDIDVASILKQVETQLPDASRGEQLLEALDRYNGVVINRAGESEITIISDLNKGDTVIWHPELPHGGSPAVDPFRSRLSMVVHCASDEVQVHQHDAFFAFAEGEAPADRYGYIEREGRRIAYAGEVAFM
jgi:ectoine hydroxylase-related dioxygenase (phytanoyl-CoA dioxygenase family)